MRFGGIAAALVLTAALGLPDAASAQSRSTVSTLNLTDAQRAQTAPAQGRRSLRWIDGGRWGLDFNLSQPVGREADWGDVEAGAYYRLSPRLRLGASAGLAAPRADPARAPEADTGAQPRVRLESIFKF